MWSGFEVTPVLFSVHLNAECAMCVCTFERSIGKSMWSDNTSDRLFSNIEQVKPVEVADSAPQGGSKDFCAWFVLKHHARLKKSNPIKCSSMVH